MTMNHFPHSWTRRLGLWCCAATLVALGSAPVWSSPAQPLAEDPVVEARLVEISSELRCLVCQNESLASSRAELANDLREEVRKLIRQNQSDEQIKQYLVSRYGDFVLYRPAFKPVTWLLWFGPFALLVLGLWMLVRHVRQRQSQVQAPPLSEADRKRAEQLLQDGASE